MKELKDWVTKNCKFAAFQSPKDGDRIELPNKPGEYYLVLEKPRIGRDQRGSQFWYARVKDKAGREQTLSSDNIASWKHYQGSNYQWHDEQIAKKKWETQQEEQAQLIADFESKYIFHDGQPLRTNPRRPMLVNVAGEAIGDLSLFADEQLYIVEIDYMNEAVKMSPQKQEFKEMAGQTAAVPASLVVKYCTPAMSEEVKHEPVRLPDGQVITAEELLHMTPGLNEMARRGMVELRAQVYLNYENARGVNGEEYFVREMAKRGIDPNMTQEITQYRLNETPAKYGPDNRRTNIFGAWQGDVYISPPISKEAEEEILSISPESKIQRRRDGGFLVQSNPLYKQMVSLGVLERQPQGVN
jgi:hypothetical protein